MSTKIYCDIADLRSIKKYYKMDLVKGFTTNPSLMRKAGAKNYENYSKQIIKICKKKPIVTSGLLSLIILEQSKS